MIVGALLLIFGILQGLLLYINIISSQCLVEENHSLIKAIHTKQINENWYLNDTKLNLKIKQLENFNGFDGKNFFTWNKSFWTTVIANFLTYFIILVQFKETDPDGNQKPNKTEDPSVQAAA